MFASFTYSILISRCWCFFPFSGSSKMRNQFLNVVICAFSLLWMYGFLLLTQEFAKIRMLVGAWKMCNSRRLSGLRLLLVHILVFHYECSFLRLFALNCSRLCLERRLRYFYHPCFWTENAWDFYLFLINVICGWLWSWRVPAALQRINCIW